MKKTLLLAALLISPTVFAQSAKINGLSVSVVPDTKIESPECDFFCDMGDTNHLAYAFDGKLKIVVTDMAIADNVCELARKHELKTPVELYIISSHGRAELVGSCYD